MSARDRSPFALTPEDRDGPGPVPLSDRLLIHLRDHVHENQLPDWVLGMVKSKGYEITHKALRLLVDHIGNDLNRLENEVEKVWLNLGSTHIIDDAAIEKYVGISKEFNVFELQHALASRDLYKAMRIIQYFESNPKAGPLQLVFPSLYNFFSKVLIVYAAPSRDEKTVAGAMGINAYFVKDYLMAAQRYSQRSIEKILLLLHHYNLKNIGIHDAGTDDAQLLKEMVAKIMNEQL